MLVKRLEQLVQPYKLAADVPNKQDYLHLNMPDYMTKVAIKNYVIIMGANTILIFISVFVR